MNLFFAEHAYQAKDFLFRIQDKDAQWIALGPSAMHYLAKSGIPFTVPEDYCTLQEAEDACVSQFERLTKVCRELDEILLSKDPFLKGWGIRPFFFYLWQLGQVLDTLLCRKIQLEKIFTRYSDKIDVHIHVAQSQPFSGYGINFSQRENLWGQLLVLPGWKTNIRICQYPSDTNQTESKGGLINKFNLIGRGIEKLKNSVNSSILLRTIFQSIRFSCLDNILNILKYREDFNHPGIVVLNSLYEWHYIIPHLISEKIPIYFFPRTNLGHLQYSNDGSTHCDTGKVCWDIFRNSIYQEPVDHSSIIRDRFFYIIENAPLFARNMIRHLNSFFSRNKIRVMITAAGADLHWYVVKQFCRKKNIKVVAWQHGAEWYNNRITQRNDLLNLVGCDQMFVFGDGVKEAYEASPFFKEEKCKVMSIGMPSLDKLGHIANHYGGTDIRILWPFGGYYGNNWYCGFSPPYTDRLYYQEQMLILNNLLVMLGKYENLSITIKLYNSRFLSGDPPWVNDILQTAKIKIIHDRHSFVELLSNHQIVIIDTPTTILLQAVATRLPVFVLNSVIRWPDEAISLLKKRAYCFESASELMSGLEQYIEGKYYDTNLKDESFLKKYGMHDNNAINNAVIELKKFIYENDFYSSGPSTLS